MAEVVRGAVRALDPNLPVENVRTLEELRSRYLATPRLTALLLALFAGLALMVTLAGLTGVIATSVSQRTREFGCAWRWAPAVAVLAGVLRQGLCWSCWDLRAGLAGAAFGRAAAGYLFDTQPTDPLTLLAWPRVLVAGVSPASGPARRATGSIRCWRCALTEAGGKSGWSGLVRLGSG